MTKPKQVDPILAVERGIRAKAALLTKIRPRIKALVAAAKKLEGHVNGWAWGTPTVYIEVPVSRIRQITPVLREFRKVLGAVLPEPRDDAPSRTRQWQANVAGVDVLVMAKLKAGATCRFVEDNVETVTIPAKPAEPERTETVKTYKLVCEE